MRRPLSVAARYLSPARGEARSGLPHQQGRHGQCVSFTYDSDGLRLTKNVDGVEHRYTWQGGKLISETWGGKKIEFFYGPEGSIDGFNYKAGPNSSVYVYYYVKNLQGDVVAIINKDGELRAEYTYDPFGKVLSATGTMADINPIRYRGYYYDQELGFYYLQSRYYDPNLCRFINADGLASTGQGFLGCNMFAYCNNNPVLLVDSEGQNPIVIWYYLFLYSEYGFIHKAVQAHIVSHSGQRVEMEVTVLRQNGTLGRADLVDKNTHAVWEVKHGAGSGAAAFAQATSYLNATIKSKKCLEILVDMVRQVLFLDLFGLTVLAKAILYTMLLQLLEL